MKDRYHHFGGTYNRHRPVPPSDIYEIAYRWANKINPAVVDIGCGTGLSTKPWLEFSNNVIGIDPSLDMLRVLKDSIANTNIRTIQATGNKTTLGDDSIDIISSSTAIHWMHPESTLNEFNRILKHKGIIVLFDHYYPLIMDSPVLTSGYERWRKHLASLEREAIESKAIDYPALSTMYPSKVFRDMLSNSADIAYSRLHYISSNLEWSYSDLIGFCNAHSAVHLLKEAGLSEDDIYSIFFDSDLDRSTILRVQLSYTVFIAIKI